MDMMTPTMMASASCIRLHLNPSQRDAADLDLEKILSRVAEVKSGWSEVERDNRRKIGESRREQLMAIVQNKVA